MDIVQEMLGRALDGFDQRVRAVGEDQRALVIPCDEWTVRDLVNHVVWVQRWTPLLIGRPNPADGGKSYEGDLPGADRKEPVELINLEQAIRKHGTTGVRNGA
jgi:hypothetical protein